MYCVNEILYICAMTKDEKRLDTLRRKVRRIIKSRGWTQKEAAERSGVDAVYVSRILSGKKNPRYTEALRLLDLDKP